MNVGRGHCRNAERETGTEPVAVRCGAPFSPPRDGARGLLVGVCEHGSPDSGTGRQYSMSAAMLSKTLLPRLVAFLLGACMLMGVGFCPFDAAGGQNSGPAVGSNSAGPPVGTAAPVPKNPSNEASAEQPAPDRPPSVYTNALAPRPDHLRTTLELAAIFAVGEGWYYGTLESPKWYWYDDFVDGMRARFVTGDAYCLDVNAWDTNMGHVFAGAGYYLLARSNDLSYEASLLYTFAASAAWEMFGEPREEFSINDTIVTPSSGFAVGEVMYQFGEFFQHSSCTAPNKALGWIFSPGAAIHRWIDGTEPKPPDKVDQFCFTTDAWHRFQVYAGGGSDYSPDKDRSRTEAALGFNMEVVTAEKYGKPGEACLLYKGGTFNEMSLDAALADDGKTPDFRFLARTAFLGYYRQNIVKSEATGTLEGSSLFYGLSTAFEYYTHKFIGYAREDKLAICDLVGPSLISDYYHAGFHMRTLFDLYPTFSMVKPAAGAVYDQTHSLQGVTGIYQEQGYYYALGLSTGGRAEMYYGPFGMEAFIRYHYFSGIEGIDRMQDRVTHDLSFEDQRLWLQLTLSCALPVDHLKLALDAGKIYRWSDIDAFSRNMDETRYFARVVYEF